MVTYFLVVWVVVAGSGEPVRIALQEMPSAKECVAGIADAIEHLPAFIASHKILEHGQAVCEVWTVPGTDL